MAKNDNKFIDSDEPNIDGLLMTGFVLGEASFGIDARLVREVVKVGKLTHVHDAQSDVIGIRNLRGHVITVIDLAVHFNLGAVEIGPDTRLLIMEHKGESFGFLVDAVSDAITLERDKISRPPDNMNADLRNRLSGVWRENEKLTAILDPEKLFVFKDA